DYSEDTAIKIDKEVQKIIGGQYERARKILEDNRDALIRLAEALLEFETLNSIQIRRAIAGLPIDENAPAADGKQGTPDAEEESKNPFKKPILPPTPATA